MKYLTFDSGNLSPEFRGTDQPISRAIEIEINDNSASLFWSYDLSQIFWFASGNAQKLENGNVLITQLVEVAAVLKLTVRVKLFGKDYIISVFLMVLSTEHIEYLDYTRQHIAF